MYVLNNNLGFEHCYSFRVAEGTRDMKLAGLSGVRCIVFRARWWYYII